MQQDAHKSTAELLDEIRELRQRNIELEKLLSNKTEAEINLRAVSEKALDAIIISDQDGNIVFWNKAATEIFGYEKEEIIGNPMTMLISDEAMGEYNEGKDHVLERGGSLFGKKPKESIAKRKDGTTFTAEFTVSNWKIGDRYCFGGSLRDISEQKRKEELLRESEKRFEDIFNYAADGIIIADAKTRKFYDGNNAICKMLGYSREELRNLSAEKIHPVEYLPYVTEQFDKMVKDGGDYALELPALRKDGSVFYTELIARPMTVDGKQCLIGFFRNVIERRRLQEERERILNMSQDFICIAGVDGYFKYVNPAAERILGYLQEELLARPFLDFIHPEDHYKNDEAVEKLSSDKMLSDFENRYIHKDGSIRYLSWAAAMLLEQGLIYCIGRDITENKMHEEALKESEERFRAVAETSPDAILITDQSGAVAFWNTAAVTMFGYEEREIVGKSYTMLIPERLRKQDQKAWKQFFKTDNISNNTKPFETIAHRKDGKEFPVEITFSGWKAQGRYFFSFIMRDITMRKQAEQAIITTKEFLESVYNTTPDVLLVTDDKGYITNINKAVEKMLGFRQEKMVGKHTSELISKDGQKTHRTRNMMRDLSRKGAIRGYQTDLITKDGGLCPAELNITILKDRDGKGVGAVAVVRDVTERKHAEQELLNSQSFLENIYDTTADVIMVSDDKGYVTRVNKAVKKVLGFSPEELVGKHTSEFFPKDEKHTQIGLKGMTELREKGSINNLEANWLRKDGSLCPVELNITRLQDRDGTVLGGVASIRDITERKQQEEAVRERETRFRTIAESMSDGIITADSSGKILFCNKAVKRIYGYTAEELVGKSVAMLEHPAVRPASKKRRNGLIKAGLEQHIGNTLEGIGLRKNGSTFFAEVSQSQWKIGNQIIFGGIVRDITDRKQMEEQLKRSHDELDKKVKQKTDELRAANKKLQISEKHLKGFAATLLSVREEERKKISTDIHDELGSMVIAVDSQLSLAREECNENNKQATVKALTKAQTALRETVADLRKIVVALRPPNLEIMGLTAAVTELLDKARQQVTFKIAVKNELGKKKIPEDRAIVIYRIIQEGLTNITKHAKAKSVQIKLYAAKKNLCVEITDDGKGCNLDKTKSTKKIGIEGMRERVESLKGEFTITSAPKRGTQIKVTLPKK